MVLLTNNDLPSYDRRILEKAYRDEVKPGATAYEPLSNKIREKIRGPANDLVSNTVWATISALDTNMQATPAMNLTGSLSSLISSSAFLQPMAAQWLFGSAPMLILAGAETLYRNFKGETLTPEELAKIWAPPTASTLAIPMWDIGQLIGAHLGATSSLLQNSPLWFGSTIGAGLIAAPFAGVLGGVTQWGVKYLFDLATNPEKQEMWRQEPALMGKVL